MKLTKYNSIWSFLLMLVCTISVQAIDLRLTNPSINPDPIIPNSSYDITVDIENLSSAITPEDASTVVVTIDGFNPANATGLLSNSSNWNCSYSSVVVCDRIFSSGGFSPGATETLTVSLSTGASVINPDTFSVFVADDALTDDNIADNSIDITTANPLPPSPDYNILVGTQGSPLVIDPVTPTVFIPFDFTIDNIGTGIGSGIEELVSIVVAPGFVLQNLAMTSANNVWTCAQAAGNDWQCQNMDSFGGMLVNEVATISGDMTTYDIANDVAAAIVATISASSDIDVNGGSNTTTIGTSIIAIAPLVFEFLTGTTIPLITLNSGDLSPQTIDYEMTNTTGTNAPAGAVISIAFDHINFGLVNSNFPSGWTCSVTGAGVLDCMTATAFASGDTAFFQFDLTALGTTPSGVYTNTVVASAFEFISPSISKSNSPELFGGIIIQAVTNVTINAPIDPDIVIDKTFEQGFVIGPTTQAGENSHVTYKLLVNAIDTTGVGGSNDGASVQIVDVLPAGLIFDSMNILGNNFACTEVSGTITCDVANLPITTADDGVEITVQVTGAAGSVITNTATVTASNDLNTGNNTSSPGAFTVVSTLPTTISVEKLAIISGFSVDTVANGGDFVYRMRVQNTGTSDALSIQLIDDVPLGVVVTGVSGTGWSCINSGQLYTCDFPDPLAPNATTILNFNSTAPLSGSQLFNTVNVSSPNAPNESAFVVTNLTDLNIDFDVVVTQNPDPIEVGEPFDLIIDVVNNGSEIPTGLSIVNTIPEGFSYTAFAKTSTCSVNGQSMTCIVNNPIAINSVESIVVGVQAISNASASSIYTNMTTVSGAGLPSPVVINTDINVNIPGAGAGDFNYTIELSDNIDPAKLNEMFVYSVKLINTGSTAITFMDLELDIPSDLTIDFNSIVTNSFNCVTASFGLTCHSDATLDIIPDSVNSVVLVEIPVVSTTYIGVLDVELTANLDTAVGVPVQRVTVETTTIINDVFTPDLSVEISEGNAIAQGESRLFEVKVENRLDQAKNVTLEMELTGILDSVSVDPGNEWTCQTANQLVNCQFNNENMPIGQQSTIVVTANTTQVVLDSQDLGLSAEVKTDSMDINIANNIATSLVVVSGTPTEGQLGDAIRDALGSAGNSQLDRAIDNISEFCEQGFFTALEGLCDDLYNDALEGESETILNFLREVTPNEVIGQSTSIAELAEAQRRNISARTNQLRSGGGSGFSSAGLNARYGSSSIPLGMLAYLNQTEDEKKANSIATDNDFISPWGFFVNGTISMGERDATGRELGFDFDTFGITAGVDYRIDAKKVVGLAIGYASFDSDIEDSAELNSQGITLTGYGSFYINDNFYVDTRISVGKPNFDQSRKIDFTLGSTHIDRVAVGETDANQYSVSMSAGYSFYKNAWNITPNASFTYMTTTIDSFTETGAGDFNFYYAEQDLKSLVWSAGIRVSKAISLKNGVITPQFDFDYNYEGLNDDSLIEARFVRAPDDQIFIIETDSPDRSYGSAGLGFVYISANGKQVYINYRSVLGLEGFSRGTYNIGARFEF